MEEKKEIKFTVDQETKTELEHEAKEAKVSLAKLIRSRVLKDSMKW